MSIPGYLNLDNLKDRFPKDFTADQTARAQTIFLKKLALAAHEFYGGKMMTIPKAGIYGFGWFGVWYTPGVSSVSTAIRDDNLRSFELSNRGNTVAVISDSTRVLGDGDVSPPGGLGVMEGKAFLMYYLGGMSAVALCINSHTESGWHQTESWKHPTERHDHAADKIIEFTRMVAPSFGAVNLEDIAQPNCYKVLDNLQDCGIPVWHDDAQGTACVTLAGMINALKLTGRSWAKSKVVFWGAGASNTTIVRLMLVEGLHPENIIVFDTKGALHAGRDDIEKDKRFYRKWEICKQTNPKRVDKIEEAMKGADVLCALSTPGPGVVPKSWVSAMADKSIVFACANPVPEIYPHEAKEAGATIVATGRSDFPNQVNNSLGFPGILKGSLLVRASKVTDSMAVAAAHAIAKVQEKQGLDIEHIVPTMDDVVLFPQEATDVALQAMKEGVARRPLGEKEIFQMADRDIREARDTAHLLMEKERIKPPPESLVQRVLDATISEVRGAKKA